MSCWCDCGKEGAVGMHGPRRESLSAGLEPLRRLPPTAIIHRRQTPCEADDGCLARGPGACCGETQTEMDF